MSTKRSKIRSRGKSTARQGVWWSTCKQSLTDFPPCLTRLTRIKFSHNRSSRCSCRCSFLTGYPQTTTKSFSSINVNNNNNRKLFKKVMVILPSSRQERCPKRQRQRGRHTSSTNTPQKTSLVVITARGVHQWSSKWKLVAMSWVSCAGCTQQR